MSAQICEPAAYTHLDELLNTSIFNDRAVENFTDLPVNGVSSDSLLFNDSAGFDLLPTLNRPVFNNQQFVENLPYYGTGQFQMGHIDPKLVSGSSAGLDGGGALPCETSSDLLPQTNYFVQYDQETQDPAQISSSIISAISPAITQHPITQSPPSTNNPKAGPQRRRRRKKAPLPPAVQEQKRQAFLAKNRVAAVKCREKNRRKWERVGEECDSLKMLNKVMREDIGNLIEEMRRLRSLVGEHGDCGDERLSKWIEGYKDLSGVFGRHLGTGGEESMQESVGIDGNVELSRTVQEPSQALKINGDVHITSTSTMTTTTNPSHPENSLSQQPRRPAQAEKLIFPH